MKLKEKKEEGRERKRAVYVKQDYHSNKKK